MTESLCNIGARFQSLNADGGGWLPMQTAPRDGTPVELRNSYGVAPHYGLYKWTEESRFINSDSGSRTGVRLTPGECRWNHCNGSPCYPSSEAYLLWRPYKGTQDAYIDPTNGAMNDGAYWRGAAAALHKLPPHYFEKTFTLVTVAQALGIAALAYFLIVGMMAL